MLGTTKERYYNELVNSLGQIVVYFGFNVLFYFHCVIISYLIKSNFVATIRDKTFCHVAI